MEAAGPTGTSLRFSSHVGCRRGTFEPHCASPRFFSVVCNACGFSSEETAGESHVRGHLGVALVVIDGDQ